MLIAAIIDSIIKRFQEEELFSSFFSKGQNMRSLVNIRGVVFGVIIVFLFGLLAVAREHPSATELLDRYAANQDRIGSSIMYKCEYSSMGSGRVYRRRSEIRCEGNRIRVVFHREPERVLEKRDGLRCAGGVCGVDKGSYESFLWEDDWRLMYQKVEQQGYFLLKVFSKGELTLLI